MAHFAKLDENNKVVDVIVVANAAAPDEKTGQDMLAESGFEGRWIQTSYNTVNATHHRNDETPFRGKFAAVGDVYDEENDIFKAVVGPENWVWHNTYKTWAPSLDHTWHKESFTWQPPGNYVLNEKTLRWEEPTK